MTRTGIYGIYIYPKLVHTSFCSSYVYWSTKSSILVGDIPKTYQEKKTSHFMTSLVVSSPWFATNLIILLNFSTFPTNKSDFKTSLAPPHLAGANAWPRHWLSGIGPRSFFLEWTEEFNYSFCLFLNTPVKIKGYCIFPLKWEFEIFSHPYPPSKKPMVFRDVTVMAGFSVVSMLGRVMNLDSERRCHWAMNICFTRQCFTRQWPKPHQCLMARWKINPTLLKSCAQFKIAMICMYI